MHHGRGGIRGGVREQLGTDDHRFDLAGGLDQRRLRDRPDRDAATHRLDRARVPQPEHHEYAAEPADVREPQPGIRRHADDVRRRRRAREPGRSGRRCSRHAALPEVRQPRRAPQLRERELERHGHEHERARAADDRQHRRRRSDRQQGARPIRGRAGAREPWPHVHLAAVLLRAVEQHHARHHAVPGLQRERPAGRTVEELHGYQRPGRAIHRLAAGRHLAGQRRARGRRSGRAPRGRRRLLGGWPLGPALCRLRRLGHSRPVHVGDRRAAGERRLGPHVHAQLQERRHDDHDDHAPRF